MTLYPCVSVEPLRALLERDLAGESTLSLSRRTGLHPRQFYRWRHETSRAGLYAVDQYLTRTGRSLMDVYPEAYE